MIHETEVNWHRIEPGGGEGSRSWRQRYYHHCGAGKAGYPWLGRRSPCCLGVKLLCLLKIIGVGVLKMAGCPNSGESAAAAGGLWIGGTLPPFMPPMPPFCDG